MAHSTDLGIFRRGVDDSAPLVVEMSNRSRKELARRGANIPGDEPDRLPPGGVMIVALLAGVSGALMGFLFAGALSFVAVAVVSLVLGLALGIFMTSRHIL